MQIRHREHCATRGHRRITTRFHTDHDEKGEELSGVRSSAGGDTPALANDEQTVGTGWIHAVFDAFVHQTTERNEQENCKERRKQNVSWMELGANRRRGGERKREERRRGGALVH